MWPFRRKKVSAPVVLNIYDPGDEGVYRYKTGRGKWVDADPMELVRRLAAVADGLNADLQMARSKVVANLGNPKMKAAQDAAYDAAMDKLRGVFDVKPLSAGGLSDIQLMSLFYHFTNWIEEVKKNWKQIQTSVEATSSPTPPPESPVAENGPPTSPTSGSGSTEGVPPAEPPTPTTSPPSCPPEQSTQERGSGSP